MCSSNAKKPRGRPRGATTGKKWDSASEDEPSDPESDTEASDDDDEKKPAAKKARGEAPPPVSKRAGLARGKGNENAAEGKAPAEKEKVKTRGVIKKLGRPRAMKLKDKAEISDISDDDEEDGMEVDA